MSAAREPLVLELDGTAPVVAADAYVAPGVTLVGDVRLESGASIWFGTVLRGDGDAIRIGAGTNIQDGCVGHADPGFPLLVGSNVSVGHRAVLHGCTVEDDVLVGMGAIVLNGARIGSGSLIAAGAVVLEGTDVPPGSLVAGVPGKVRRELGEQELERVRENARSYHRNRDRYASQPGRP